MKEKEILKNDELNEFDKELFNEVNDYIESKYPNDSYFLMVQQGESHSAMHTGLESHMMSNMFTHIIDYLQYAVAQVDGKGKNRIKEIMQAIVDRELTKKIDKL